MKSLACALGTLLLAIGPALANPTASELFFDAPYLSRVEPGSKIDYAYKHSTSEAKLGESFDEKLQLKVSVPAEDPKQRIAEVDIWRGDRHTEAGPFPTMNGNPISLILLERDVKEMAQLTKGSPYYIRNRVRDHIATGAVTPVTFDYGGRSVEGWKLTMTPFAEDPNKDKLAELSGRRYEFLFSDAVPGGLYSIEVVTPRADGSANIIETRLSLAGAAPAATK